MNQLLIDWKFAVTVGAKLAGQGPAVSPEDARAAVAELRAGADRATGLVRDFTGLHARERTAPVLVIDRRGWIEANAASFQILLGPVIDKLQASLAERKTTPAASAIGSRVTGAEIGLMLGFLSGKVLGQFDPFHTRPGEDGRLLLVAPNIVQVERELDVDPHDFRLWVCLHEETHRVQFTAVDWLRDHLRGEVEKLAADLPSDPSAMLADAAKRLGAVVRGESDGSIADLLSTPAQREVIERVTGVMSLLEGHADVVMDGVGPEVIGSVAEIRSKFTQRRKGLGVLDRLIRRLLGLDQKMAQYRDGAVFVRAVIDKVGMDGFNKVWESPETLPSKAEILDPALWLARVHP